MLARTEEEQEALDAERAMAVKGAIMHAWDGYKQWAWGMDELAPVSKGGLNWFGLGLTLVDSLDLLWLIGEKDEFQGARNWVATELNIDQDVHVNVFETIIRVMGGLLSAYFYSNDEVFLIKAQALGANLRSAMNSPSGVPWSDAILATKRAFAPASAPESSISEATSIQLEFKYLAHASKDESLYRLAEHSMRAVDAARAELPTEGHRQVLLPMFIDAKTGKFNQGATITLGARGDSYYEYLLKQWLLTGKKEDFYKQRFLEAVEGIKAELFRHSEPEGKAFIAELGKGVNFSPKMDHLVCYLPGTLALGVYHGLDPDGTLGHMEMAKELMVTCFEFYNQTATGLSPEIAFFRVDASRSAGPSSSGASDLYVKPSDAHNILRPETVESLFYLYRLTGDRVYQEWAWQIFVAFEKHAKVATGGYSGLRNVEALDSARIDKMESFFLGETLKYFYLLFADPALLSLDEVVFNTEAHSFPVLAPEEDWLVYKGKGEQPPVDAGTEKEEEEMEVKAEADEVKAEEEGGREEKEDEEKEEEERIEEMGEELKREEEDEVSTAEI
jgi:mannosyl-oligosaccharide alpha-1,2-mannosidase